MQGVGIATLIFRYFLRYFSSTPPEQISPDSAGPFIVSIPVGFAIFSAASLSGVVRCLHSNAFFSLLSSLFSSTSTEQIFPDSTRPFSSFDPAGFAIFAIATRRALMLLCGGEIWVQSNAPARGSGRGRRSAHFVRRPYDSP